MHAYAFEVTDIGISAKFATGSIKDLAVIVDIDLLGRRGVLRGHLGEEKRSGSEREQEARARAENQREPL
jgi:hypothetical protein